MSQTYIAPGRRTPFVRAGGALAPHDAITISATVVRRMVEEATPDLLIWGQVIPALQVSNIGRELVLEAGLPATLPAFSTVLACATSMVAAIQASGMVGTGGRGLALIGGVETMSRVPIGLKPQVAARIAALATNPMAAAQALSETGFNDFDLPVRGWANRISGRSMGEHTEDTAKRFAIARADQDRLAFESHRRAVAAQDAGFFDDLLVPFGEVAQDLLPRRDSTLEKLATLPAVFDRSGAGSLTAGNSSPLTDGAAGLWVADAEKMRQMPGLPWAQLEDWELAAMDYAEEGILMAPARAIPRLLARHGLRLEDVALWEIHEAFAAQVLANVKAVEDPAYRKGKAGVNADLGRFPWDRMNPNGGSLAIGHPFAATGARILGQAAKELAGHPVGSRAVVSICADGGQGAVILLRRP